jgi:glycosyltransferase involved in cell wall biosynthesis
MSEAERLALLFDARHADASGIGSYTRLILEQLPAWASTHGVQVGVLARSPMAELMPGLQPGLQWFQVGSRMYSLKEQQDFARLIRQIEPRIFWTPHYVAPFWPTPGTRIVLTVHDVIHTLPSSEGGPGALRRAYAAAMLRLANRRADLIFVQSEHTRATLLGKDSRFADRIVVTPFGISNCWFENSDEPVAAPARPYVVYLGNLKKHKNVVRLLEAYEQVMDRVPYDLVLAGGALEVQSEDEGARRKARELEPRVRAIGHQPLESLRELIRNATALVLPSLHEGMGLPPLEAMATGTAVLASRIPAVLEVCGEAVEYFDPRNVEDISRSLTLIADDEARLALVERGLAHVAAREKMIDNSSPLRLLFERLGGD